MAFAGWAHRKGGQLTALSFPLDGIVEAYNLMVLLASILSGCVSLNDFPDLSVPQLAHLGHGIEPGDGGVRRTVGS